MNLTPEQRRLGKDNFHSVVGMTRRDFLLGAAAAGLASGAGLGAYYFGYEPAIGNPVRVGVIGTGDEGGVLIGAHNPEFVNVVAIADIRPYSRYRAFHGDQSTESAKLARPGLLAKYDWHSESEARQNIKVYENDYHDLLNDSDVEAVIIALPLHLHAVVAIEAMKAGKHVLTEKLMGHSVAECKEMARIANDTGLLLATGHQRHYSVLYDNAVDTIRRGLVGKIHHIRAQWHRGNLPGRDSWSPKLPADIQEELGNITAKLDALTADSGADIDRTDALMARKRLLIEMAKDADVDPAAYGYVDRTVKIGTADDAPTYNLSGIEELIRWRLWNRTGGGLMAELGSHQLDAAGIFMTAMREAGAAKALPLTVTAFGHRSLFDPDRDCEDHVHCMYEYGNANYDPADPQHREDKTVVSYSSINGNQYGGYGEVVMGTDATLILEREQETMLFQHNSTSRRVRVANSGDKPILQTTDSVEPAAAIANNALAGPVSKGYTEEIEHWAWCIRNPDPENKPRCYPQVALADAVIALTTNVAIREGRKIDFQDSWFDIDSDETPDGSTPDVSKYDS